MQSKTSATILLLGTFLLGGIAGAVSHSLYRAHADGPGTRPPRPRGDMVENLARDLQLSPEQKNQIKQIIEESRERFRALHQQTGPQFAAIRNESRERMRAVLRDDQKAKFEEILRDIDARRRERGPPR